MNLYDMSCRPLKLKCSRVWRTYTGGMPLEKWHGLEDPKDGHFPEEWVASTIESRNIDQVQCEGMSKYELEDGSEVLLKDIIDSNPAVFLGKYHAEKYGNNMAVLVKLIDSFSRLLVQVHPDREYAKEVLGSAFGKTEAWYILGGRTIDGQEPYVLLGFKPGITKEIWEDMFKKQDKEAMVNALHRFNVKPGEVYLINSGVPHAIGSGCFLIEVQEPTDYTMRVERTATDGTSLPDAFCHQGAGFERMFDCFHYDCLSREETIEKYLVKPSIVRKEDEGVEESLISYGDTPYFAMNRIKVTGTFKDIKQESFLVAVIISGHGRLIWDTGEMEVKQADQFLLPAGLRDIIWQSSDGQYMEIVKCFPPR